jgi:hypothetical protein
MKKLLFVITTTFCMLSNIQLHAQQEELITNAMALKIGTFCHNKSGARAIFEQVNQLNSMEADRVIRGGILNHMDYVENFIIGLYDNYGVQMSYFALVGDWCWFTLEEVERTEKYYTQVKAERRKAYNEKQAKEAEKSRVLELEYKRRIDNNDWFQNNELSVMPSVELAIQEIPSDIGLNTDASIKQREFKYAISSNGSISEIDTDNLSNYEKTLYILFKSRMENITPGYVNLNGVNTPVNSYLSVMVNETNSSYGNMESVWFWMRKKKVNREDYYEIDKDNLNRRLDRSIIKQSLFYAAIEREIMTGRFRNLKRGGWQVEVNVDISAQIDISINYDDNIRLSIPYKILDVSYKRTSWLLRY